MKKICLWLFVFTLAALNLQAQIKEPVKFKTSFKSISPTEAEIIFSGTIDNGWHVYSTNLPDGGPYRLRSMSISNKAFSLWVSFRQREKK